MPELKIHTAEGETCVSFEGTPLLHDLIAGLPDAPGRPCGGGGSCGGCAVAAKGMLSQAPDARGRVLACQTHVTGDAEVWLPKRSQPVQIETRVPDSDGGFDPQPGKYGAAVDLGTTTIVLSLHDLSDGRRLSLVSCENPQRVMAADVIGRIGCALKGSLPALRGMAQTAIEQLEREAFRQAGLPGAAADVRVVAGNTTMLYLYTGRDPEPLSHAPFAADCLFALHEGRDLLPGCSGAFVGADITCAVLVSGMCGREETAMLIDIGTNGEIALWHKGKLYCCATAAGPAFEGGGIACGTGSIPGAIDSVSAQGNGLNFTTIGGGAPAGICGSGLIDLIAALLDTEQMDETGALDDDVQLSPEVYLDQKDVRQVQLAKGAIAAGMRTLMRYAGVGEADVQRLYIAGGFGNHLNLRSAARIGLLPETLAERAVALGNASLGGAQRLLLDRSAWAAHLRIAEQSECLNLAEIPGFSDEFIECMMFEEI